MLTQAQAFNEFTGPFNSWANLKDQFGAKGNGKDDDTKAFQKALDRIGEKKDRNLSSAQFTVLYVPAGTYIISSTLVFRGKIGVAIIGEDPSNTIIKWKGPGADTIFWANGSAFYKIARFTWDANGRKDMEALGIHWKNRWNDGKSQSYASLCIELSDHRFIGNFKYGISGGTSPDNGTGNNDSELTIRRCIFNRCTEAGLNINGYNALDYWVWDCQFQECKVGIRSSFGNFHAYRSYFRKSEVSDVFQSNGYYTSVRGCFSEGSRAFSLDDGFSINPFKRIFQSNTVIKPRNIPVQFYHWGKLTAMDNSFDASTDTGVHMFFKTGSWGGGSFQLMSIGNKYSYKAPVLFTATPNRFYSYKDEFTFQPQNRSAAFIQNMESTPKKGQSTIFEVAPNASDKSIQELINKVTGNKLSAILHFPLGIFIIHQPLIIPAGSSLQFVGDGALEATIIQAAADFPKGKPLIQVNGAKTFFSIAELQLGRFDTGKKDIDGIDFDGVDESQSQAFIDQLYSNATWSLQGQELDYLYIEKDNSFFSDGNLLTGGKLTEAGKGIAVLNCFGGQYAGISIDKNAKAIFKDCWWEGGKRIPVALNGKGSITIDGAMVAPNKVDSNTTIDIQQFSGRISLLNMYIQGAVNAAPNNPNLKLLLWNINFSYTLDPFRFVQTTSNFKTAWMGLTSQCFTPNDKKCETIYNLNDHFKSISDTAGFLVEMTRDDRLAMPRLMKRSKACNIYISRVSIGDCNTAIRFRK